MCVSTGVVDVNYGISFGVTCGSTCTIEATTSQDLDACALACTNSQSCQGIEYSTHPDVQVNQAYCKLLSHIDNGGNPVPKDLTKLYYKGKLISRYIVHINACCFSLFSNQYRYL